MSAVRLFAAAALVSLMAACAPTLGPPPPPRGSMMGAATTFRAEDFAWSAGAGRNGVAGKVAYVQGQTHFTCAKSTVILTPETPWTRERMIILYKSAERAALPSDEVRARTPAAPGGDYSAYVRRTTCDASDHFAFTGVPDGSWFAITIVHPIGGGPSMALMRRVVTARGRVTITEL
jgi:hypothetical protein